MFERNVRPGRVRSPGRAHRKNSCRIGGTSPTDNLLKTDDKAPSAVRKPKVLIENRRNVFAP